MDGFCTCHRFSARPPRIRSPRAGGRDTNTKSGESALSGGSTTGKPLTGGVLGFQWKVEVAIPTGYRLYRLREDAPVSEDGKRHTILNRNFLHADGVGIPKGYVCTRVGGS